jgi:hypothetical protein
LASAVLLFPPSHFTTSGDSVRSVPSPPTRASSPQPTTPAPAPDSDILEIFSF